MRKWTTANAVLVTLLLAVGANAQVLQVYDDVLYYQPSTDKGAHGAFERITLSEIEDHPVDGNYLKFNHNIAASSSTVSYARMMFTSNGRLRRPSQYDTGMNLTEYNRLNFRARAPQLTAGQTCPVTVAMGIDTYGSQDTGSKSATVQLNNQWQEFEVELAALNPGGAGTLASINCLFSLTFYKANGSAIVDFDDIRYSYSDPFDPKEVYVDSFNCEGIITQGDGATIEIFQETTQNPPVPTANETNKIKIRFDPAAGPGGPTWVRKALTHLTYWKNNSTAIGRNLTGCTMLKFRAVAVVDGGGASYPVTFEMGKDFYPEPFDSGSISAQIAVLSNNWHEYSISLTSLLPPPNGSPPNLSDINDLFNVVFHEGNGAGTLYIDDIRYE